MPRNFYRRIECVFPLKDPAIRERLIHILEVYLTDTKNARFLRANGSYTKSSRNRKGNSLVSAQKLFLEESAYRKQETDSRKPQEGHSEHPQVILRKPPTK